MKLIIQIPCFNERATLRETLGDLPRSIAGVDEIEVLIIDDGSTDGTSELARELGVKHVVRFSQNRGLAKGFMAGLDASLKLGADIIVNTDADNQYSGADIPELIRPILEGRADFVVGDRQVDRVEGFSSTKKRLQKLGSWVVRLASSTIIPDATSGFRAISREVALRLFVTSEFTYTLETIIQAGQAHLAVTAVPIRTNPKKRESRLFRSIPQYLRRSASTIVRSYAMYKPLKAFLFLAMLLFLVGSGLGVRFLYYHLTSASAGHIQSLILAAVLLIAGFIVGTVGLLADLVGANRKLLEDAIIRLRRLEYDLRGARGLEKSPLLPPREGLSLTRRDELKGGPRGGPDEAHVILSGAKSLWIKAFIGLAITASLFALLFRFIDLSQVGELFAHTRWSLLLAGLAFWAIIYLVRAVRFTLLAPRTPYLTMLCITAVHNFCIRLLPLRTGELAYAFLLQRAGTAGLGESLIGLLLLRILDSTMVVLLFAIALALHQGIYLGDRRIGVLAASGVGVLGMTLVLTLVPLLRLGMRWVRALTRITGVERRASIRSALEKVAGAVECFSQVQRGAIHWLAALSLVQWLLTFASFFAMMRAFFMPVGVAQTTLGSTAAVVTGFLPIGGIGSFGTLEAGWALGFVLVGLERQKAIASGFGISITTFFYGAFLGLIGWIGLIAQNRRGNKRGSSRTREGQTSAQR